MNRILFAAALAVCVMFVGGLIAAEVKSSVQPGEKIPGPFHPLNVNGASAGKKECLVCKNGANPVAMIFARTVDPKLVKLIKKLDEATVKNESKEMGSFVVFCSDNEKLEDTLKGLAKTESLKKLILSIDNPAGPKGFNVSADADVTVILYNEHKVESNHAFKKGELDDKAIEAILSDLPKILK